MGIEPRHSDAEGQPITHAGCVGLFENVLHAGHDGLPAWNGGAGSQHREPFAETSLPVILGFGQLHCASLVCTPSPNYQVKAVFPIWGYSFNSPQGPSLPLRSPLQDHRRIRHRPLLPTLIT
jgi:hypothetical protein